MNFQAMLDKLIDKARFKPKPREESTGPHFAALNERAIASAIDIVILYMLLFPLFLMIQSKLFKHIDEDKFVTARQYAEHVNSLDSLGHEAALLWASGQPQLWLLNMALQLAIIGTLIIVCQVNFGYTPGKYLFGLRIVRASDHTQRPSIFQYILRFVGYIVSSIPLMAGIIWISFNKQHRAWHDYLAGTVVLDTRPRGWYWGKFKQGVRWVRAGLK